MFVFIQTLILVCLSFQHRFLFSNWKFFFQIFFSCVDDSIHKNKKNTDKRSFVDPVVVIGVFFPLCVHSKVHGIHCTVMKNWWAVRCEKNYLAGIQSYNLGQRRAGQGIFSHRKAIFNRVGLNLGEVLVGKYIVLFCHPMSGI